MKIKIRKSVPNDVYGIREVQRVAWLKTYPNNKEEITKEDIIKKFEIDKTPEGKKKIEERRSIKKKMLVYGWQKLMIILLDSV